MKFVRYPFLVSLFSLVLSGTLLIGCSKQDHAANHVDTIYVDNGAEVPTLDPTLSQDVNSSRVLYDLVEGLTSFDQANQVIPGLAEKWEISPDKKTYTFHLRPGLLFSDGTPITAEDVVFTWQRLVDPKIASPYSFLCANVINGQAIMDGKLPLDQLAVKALDPLTIRIQLVNPDEGFLSMISLPNLGVLSKANVISAGAQWNTPGKMVSSGAYVLKEWVVNGHILLTKNSHYYDASNVSVPNIQFFPIDDTNSSLSQYKAGNIDVTYSVPIDQYKQLKVDHPDQLHTVAFESIYYYDFNMTLPKFKDNPKLRQALSMAVDRERITQEVLGQEQVPSYTYATRTIEGGKFAGLDYPWSKWPREKQLATAQALFKESGYGPQNPLSINISYNTNDANKKVALAVASMWQSAFGADSIQVSSANQEWKTFIKARSQANYDMARDSWVADYDNADTYTILYTCNNPQNNSKYCNPAYDKLVQEAKATSDPARRIQLLRQAFQLAMQDYAVIPMFQYTYYRLVSPRIKGYEIEKNYFDHVLSKWYKLEKNA